MPVPRSLHLFFWEAHPMRHLLIRFLVFSTLLSAAPALLQAQNSSSMTGTVTDRTGAVIPGATVVVTNPLRGTTFTQTTDNKGSCRFANVPPKTGYKASFSRDGFATLDISSIVLSVGVTRTQDATLSAGTATSVEDSAVTSGIT